MSTMIEFGFVAALEREVAGVLRLWKGDCRAIETTVNGAPLKIFLHGNAALICAGIGIERAHAAALALLDQCRPQMLISVGFAGSCVAKLKPGAVVIPATVLHAATGEVTHCAFGEGQLVTLDRIAGKHLKYEAAAHLSALAVDMEAAGVAKAAAERLCGFAAIKAISDGADDDVEMLSGFVGAQGFQTSRFLAHVAFRPALWPKVAALGRNSRLAAAALAGAITECAAGRPALETRAVKGV